MSVFVGVLDEVFGGKWFLREMWILEGKSFFGGKVCMDRLNVCVNFGVKTSTYAYNG